MGGRQLFVWVALLGCDGCLEPRVKILEFYFDLVGKETD